MKPMALDTTTRETRTTTELFESKEEKEPPFRGGSFLVSVPSMTIHLEV